MGSACTRNDMNEPSVFNGPEALDKALCRCVCRSRCLEMRCTPTAWWSIAMCITCDPRAGGALYSR